MNVHIWTVSVDTRNFQLVIRATRRDVAVKGDWHTYTIHGSDWGWFTAEGVLS